VNNGGSIEAASFEPRELISHLLSAVNNGGSIEAHDTTAKLDELRADYPP